MEFEFTSLAIDSFDPSLSKATLELSSFFAESSSSHLVVVPEDVVGGLKREK